MKRIIIHWSAGTYKPNSTDLEHYHYLIGYEKFPKERAVIYKGVYKPEDNLDCKDGKYAAHTGGGNTGSIGVALCAMAGYKNIKNIGCYPVKPVQTEAMYKLCADLCIKYNIEVNSNNVMTHYEFGLKNPKTTSAGKIDIVYLSTNPSLTCDKIGAHIRNKIKWYIEKAPAKELV